MVDNQRIEATRARRGKVDMSFDTIRSKMSLLREYMEKECVYVPETYFQDIENELYESEVCVRLVRDVLFDEGVRNLTIAGSLGALELMSGGTTEFYHFRYDSKRKQGQDWEIKEE